MILQMREGSLIFSLLLFLLLIPSADPRLLGALRKTVWGGGWMKCMKEWMKCICPNCFESRSRKALEKQYLFRGSVCFQLVFFFFGLEPLSRD